MILLINAGAQHIPYLISYFDGRRCNSFYISDYKNAEDMIKACINSLTIENYNKFKIYVHNLANFDAVFLLKILVELGSVEPILNKGRLISINFTGHVKQVDSIAKAKIVNKKGIIIDKLILCSLTFYDSYQLLLASLRKLGVAFNVIEKKDIFPHLFLNNPDIPYDYVGPVPSIEYFINITIDEYNEYCKRFPNNTWSLREEAISYCELDCISLHQIIIKFSDLIYNKYSINITKFPTITGLTFVIFRSHFLNIFTIPMLSGKVFKEIKTLFTGGATDMYLPCNYDQKPIYCYDVNSLYPYIMQNEMMPIGKIVYF